MKAEPDGGGGGGGVRSQGENQYTFEFTNGTLHPHFVECILVAYVYLKIHSDHSQKQYSGQNMFVSDNSDNYMS